MPSAIDITTARHMLLTRDELIARGHTEREIRELVASGVLRRVRRGRYVYAADWDGLWVEGQHLIQALELQENSDAPGPVFWGPSAAVFHGLPLHQHTPTHVHTVIMGRRHGRSRAGVVHHNVEITGSDIVERDGIRCTSLDRTVLDLACATPPLTAICAADAALRCESMSGQVQVPQLAEAWHDRLQERAERLSTRGIRKARDILSFADGRAQFPGESVSRWHLRELGFHAPMLQSHVVGPHGEDYWLDFGFRQSRAFGEFDGKGKYLDPALRNGRSAEQVLLDEKNREDIIRGVTGWRTVRWGWEHIRTPEALATRLAAFRIYPPG